MDDFKGLRTVFLDRDGVLNRKAPEGEYVARWNLFHPLPGAFDAVGRLNRAGLKVYVVTNQRGVALGLYTLEDVTRLHALFQDTLRAQGAHIDGFFVCPHDRGACRCRKPGPGLFEQARALHPGIGFDASSVVVGDSISDIEAGVALGMRTVFIDGEPGTQKPGAARARGLAGYICASLPEAVQALLRVV